MSFSQSVPFLFLAKLIIPYHSSWRFHAINWFNNNNFYLCFIALYITHSALVMEILWYSFSKSPHFCFLEFPVELSWYLPSWVSLVDCSPSLESVSVGALIMPVAIRPPGIPMFFGILHTPRPKVGCYVLTLVIVALLSLNPTTPRNAQGVWHGGARCALHFFSTCW